MRLAFLGTPGFALPTLAALIGAGHEIVRVYTQPPRPAGRGRSLRPSPVHAAAEAAGLPAETPLRFREPEVLDGLAALGADAAVVVAYGQILPQAALDAPRLGCLNLHASLLPRWRGAAPIQRAIMAGDAETGVAVMQMEAGLDTGPVLAEARTPIGPEDTAGTLHDRLAALGAPLMVEALAALAEGRARPRPQSGDGVTYAAKIDKAEACIDWARGAAALDRHIRGLSPAPGAWTEIGAERVRILMCRPEPVPGASADGHGHGLDLGSGVPPGAPPGTALDDRLLVACGEGALRLTRLQRPGRAAADAAELLRGFPVPGGTRLG
jgi:methionyl-tRNA formyltransferase